MEIDFRCAIKSFNRYQKSFKESLDMHFFREQI